MVAKTAPRQVFLRLIRTRPETTFATPSQRSGVDLDGLSKFPRLRGHRFEEAGRLLSEAGFIDWETVSMIDEQKRKCLREDIRKKGVTSIQLSLINEIAQRNENDKPKNDQSGKKAGN